MLFQVTIRVDAWHVPTQRWHTYESPQGVRAVSRKAALGKALRIAFSLPCYTDRAWHPDWCVSAEATLTGSDRQA